MAKALEFDVSAAHKYFSANCFNMAWDLIEKTNRTPEDERLMVALNQASIYHWLQRDDCNNLPRTGLEPRTARLKALFLGAYDPPPPNSLLTS